MSVTAPATTFLQTTEYATFANDAAYEASAGAAANGDVYYNTTENVVRLYQNGSWQSQVTSTTPFAVSITDTTSSTDKDTGCLVLEGGLGVEENINVGGNATIVGNLTVQGTTTSIETTTTDITDANITVNKGGNQASANSNTSGLTVEMSDATDVVLGYDSSLSSRMKLGDSGSESEILTAATDQAITGNKTFEGLLVGDSTNDAATGDNQTLTAPTKLTVRLTGALNSVDMIPAGSDEQLLQLVNVSGGTIVLNNLTGATAANQILTGTGDNLSLADNASVKLRYDSTESKWMILGGSGSGSGAGTFNYITEGNGDTITSWVSYANTTAGSAPDDFGGTPSGNFTLTSNTSSPLRDDADLDFAKAASDEQGEGYYFPFTIRNGDLTNVSRLIANYTTSADYADDDISFFVVTSSDSFVSDFKVLRFSAEGLPASSNPNYFYSETQFGPTDTDARFCVHVASTNASAYSINAEFEFAPRSVARGSIITDWESFTPTGSWVANTTYTGYKKRVGSDLECRICLTLSGAPTSATLTLNIPDGLSIDATKVINSTASQNIFGTGWILDSGSSQGIVKVSYESATSVRVEYLQDGTTHITEGAVTQAAPFTFASGDEVIVNFSVPIEGWAGTGNVSESFGNKLSEFIAHSNGGESLTANVTDIPFSTVVKNTLGTWSGSVMTLSQSGLYCLSPSIRTSAGSTASYELYINGTLENRALVGYASVSINSGGCSIFSANAGDEISIRSNTNVTLGTTSDEIYHQLRIFKVATPETLIGSEQVSFSGAGNGGTSITANVTDIPYTTISDSHNAFSSGVFTAPLTGWYSFDGGIAVTTAVLNNIYSYVDGALFQACGRAGSDSIARINGKVFLNKGQTLGIRAANGATLSNSTLFHVLQIVKL